MTTSTANAELLFRVVVLRRWIVLVYRRKDTYDLGWCWARARR